MRITLPWPNRNLFPNAVRRLHWSALAEHRKTARIVGRYLAIEAGARHRTFPERPEVLVTFNPPDRRKRDDDGCIGALKHYRDGIADAIGIDDANWRVSYAMGDPTPKGAVIVEIAE